MSLTDRKTRRLAARVYRRILAATTARTGVREVYFQLKPNRSADSYYMPRSKRAMDPEDFELAAPCRPESLEKNLAALYSARGEEHLRAVSGLLQDLAEAMYSEEDRSDEVSPLIYEMY